MYCKLLLEISKQGNSETPPLCTNNGEQFGGFQVRDSEQVVIHDSQVHLTQRIFKF